MDFGLPIMELQDARQVIKHMPKGRVGIAPIETMEDDPKNIDFSNPQFLSRMREHSREYIHLILVPDIHPIADLRVEPSDLDDACREILERCIAINLATRNKIDDVARTVFSLEQ